MKRPTTPNSVDTPESLAAMAVDSLMSEVNDKYSSEMSDEELDALMADFTEKMQCLADNGVLRCPECWAEEQCGDDVVGWFQGRMEFGPRALGARSIIGDARSQSMQSVMNRKIKFRESFRPFAPSVLQTRVSEYFDMDSSQTSPYMLLVAPVRKDKRLPDAADTELEGLGKLQVARSTIPAVTHVDYSARVQTVDAVRHGRYHALLEAFERKTGCPVLINTRARTCAPRGSGAGLWGPTSGRVGFGAQPPQGKDMTDTESNERDATDFAQRATETRPGLFVELWEFLRHNKKWWLTPIILVLLLIGALILLAGTAAAPFIYPLF